MSIHVELEPAGMKMLKVLRAQLFTYVSAIHHAGCCLGAV